MSEPRTPPTTARLTETELIRQLRAMLDASINGIVALRAICDDADQVIDFEVTMVNVAFEQITKVPAETAIGASLLTMFPSHTETGFFDAYRQVIITGKPVQLMRYYNSGGLEAWFDISAMPSGPAELVVTFTDMTEQKRYEQQLKRSNKDLERFALVTSHDLQEPLRKIQSFSDLLKSSQGNVLSESGLNLLTRMQHAAGRMQVLIQDLLVYSRISSQPAMLTSVSLQTVVTDVLTDLELTIAEKQATVSVGTLPMVQGDALQLRQLVQNLLTNALKFSRPDVPPVVEITARPASKEDLPGDLPCSFTVLTVSDNGIGFAPEDSDKIFQLFQRLHTREQFAGTGIGLSICQKVVENHGGHIIAHSRPGTGATFEALLPVSTKQ